MMRNWVVLVSSLFLANVLLSTAFQCGQQADGALCPGDLCCSRWGYCGSTDLYCLVENGCQSNCKGDDDTGTPPSPDIDAGSLGDIIVKIAIKVIVGQISLVFRIKVIVAEVPFNFHGTLTMAGLDKA
ncbi:hypothetical protein HRI_004935600 [Hibiscus trionum]|uniref:Chitin-binding type-1 domain-containing protein n=1 Tax=Hibiscus trionum TaxID=183268 RepID=A0A9W7JFY1_HIBTR|nr:hypothetical protein HRI_004935600 [Hibiscus trionum]